MSGFSPGVIPMGKWANFTCKYGSVNDFNDVLLYNIYADGERGVCGEWMVFYIILLLTHYVFPLLWLAMPVRLNGLWRTNVRDHPTVSTHYFLLFPHHPLCRRKVTSGTYFYKAYPLLSGFSPVVIPMGKWPIFTCKYGSVNGFNVLLYDMQMGNEGFVVSRWYSR